ncbi:hypothetical protein OIU78_010092 [Salix suchowensis]|nr:hypothetical protein OIU78_010092 [Salix suchowensis]KAJ6342079.1 hypothetical protein OIU78_010092 [Salix suchowensis]KAJ6342080.1 hypothetical protein OIU78_010092 [Salix suchowensis]
MISGRIRKRNQNQLARKNHLLRKETHQNMRQWEANGWKQGNCPIAKSYRAVSRVLPLVVSTLQPPASMNLRCPPAIVAARAALARTALVKNLRPQPLPAKMLVIALLGMAVNVPLGMWKEHTEKFSLQWFAAVHAAVPFIAMLRKSVLMPKTAMALTIGASILGQIIGSRAERRRLKTVAIAASVDRYSPSQVSGNAGRHCGYRDVMGPLFYQDQWKQIIYQCLFLTIQTVSGME